MKAFSDIHPYFFACWIPLHVMVSNLGEVSWNDAWPAIVLVIVTTGLCQGLARLIFRDTARFNILLAAGWVFVFHYTALRHATGLRHRFTFLFLVVIGLSLGYLVVKIMSPANVKRVNAILSAIAAAMLMVQSIVAVSAAAGLAGQTSAGAGAPRRAGFGPTKIVQPDVFYIIFDAYSGTEGLAKVFGYDDTAFRRSLAERGFYTASESWSNYDETICSVPSSLNARYFNHLAASSSWGGAKNHLRREMAHSRVFASFAEHGYEVVSVSSTPLLTIKNSPFRHFNYFKNSAYEYRLLEKTPLAHVDLFKRYVATYDTSGELWEPESLTWVFDKVARRGAAGDRPRFIYAHVLSPHRPFYFNAEGRADPIYRDRPWTLEHRSLDEMRAAYIYQVTWLEGQILNLVDILLARGGVPPIIILQGDHGPRWGIASGADPYLRAIADFSILYSLHVPEDVRQRLYPSISPINTFGLLLDHLFALDYELQEDASYHVEHEGSNSRFSFVRQTRELK